MTTVYGVTFIGAREQIEKQLKESPYVPKEEAYMAAAYLAKKVSFFIRYLPSSIIAELLSDSLYRSWSPSAISSLVLRPS